MKSHFKYYSLILITIYIISACKEGSMLKLRAIGSPGELLVVSNTQGGLDNQVAEIKILFEVDFPALPQKEKLFKVNHISTRNFDGHLKTFRNILYIRIDDTLKRPLLRYSKNRWAQFQQIIEITGPTAREVLEMVQQNKEEIYGYYYRGDVDRLIAINQKVRNEEMIRKIKNKYDLSIVLPKGYRLRVDSTDFMWLQYDNFNTSMGLMIYDSLLVDSKDLDVKDYIRIKNTVNKERINGEKMGSYMATESILPYHYRDIQLNGKKWTEVRGLWRMEGDMMGGPYVTLFGKVDNRIIVLDAFLYAPNEDHKAHKVKALEAIINSVDLL